MKRRGGLPAIRLSQLYIASLFRRFGKRLSGVLLFFFFLFALRQLINSQMELSEHLRSKGKDDFLSRIGAKVNQDHADGVNIPANKKIQGRTGLTTKGLDFFLNGKPFRILGGSIHYFRFPFQYWRHRLLALKASGLNTVTTYVAWNAHEPLEGRFDFSGSLNLPNFIQIAHDLDLYVIVRIGPYICAEWEWGGLPSWLLHGADIKVRTTDPAYMTRVKNWFNTLLPIIKPYQYTYGGPVIAIQVENEYGTFPNYDPDYVVKLRDMVIDSGIVEFLFVCDDKNSALETDGRLNYGGMLKSINFQHKALANLEALKKIQPDRPLFVSEYWTGWFNWWGGPNNNMGVPWLNTLNPTTFENNTKELLEAGGNMNMYMFVGGTNFGFMNGGIIHPKNRGNGDPTSPDTTSYDYDALVSEEGKLTKKFYVTRKLMQALEPGRKMPDLPPEPELESYGPIKIEKYVDLGTLLAALKRWMIESKNPIPMEKFPATDDKPGGQAYGYALYECTLSGKNSFKLDLNGKIRDRALVFLDMVYQEIVTPPMGVVTLNTESDTKHTVSFLVENLGRVNWVPRDQPGTFENQRKGILSDIRCNNEVLLDWRIWSLEFDKPFLEKVDRLTRDGLLKWVESQPKVDPPTPRLVKTTLTLKANPKDTFVELEGFEKGVLIVNGINIGRYWNSAGPQKRLFLPGVWLRQGPNEVLIFEERKVGSAVSFHKTSGM